MMMVQVEVWIVACSNGCHRLVPDGKDDGVYILSEQTCFTHRYMIRALALVLNGVPMKRINAIDETFAGTKCTGVLMKQIRAM